jgi:uncharacterized protein (DUF58 family)
LAFGLISVVITDIILGFIFRPRKLSVSREIPERTIKGIPFVVRYELVNEGKLPAWNICVDFLPFFEKKIDVSRTELIAMLKPGQRLNFVQEHIAPQRGDYNIYQPIVETIFPFSIFKWSKRSGKSSKIIVHPNFAPILNLTLPIGANYQIEGTSLVSKTGDSTDFIGCREFRIGDNPKHIHWPSTARKGELVIREFQEEYLTRVAIIIDTFMPPIDYARDLFGRKEAVNKRKFEALLELSAALSDYLSRSEYLLDIFMAGNEVYHLEAGRSQRKFDYLLDIISCIKPNRKEPISKLSADLLEIISSIGSTILILTKWDETGMQLWRQLSENGVTLKTILISTPSEGVPDSITCYSEEMILNGELRAL